MRTMTFCPPESIAVRKPADIHLLAWGRAALLLALFLFAGVLGHGPWKQDEPYIFGIVQHFMRTDTWLIPVDAGIPFMEKPPFYLDRPDVGKRPC